MRSRFGRDVLRISGAPHAPLCMMRMRSEPHACPDGASGAEWVLLMRDAAKNGSDNRSDVDKAAAKCFASEAYQYDLTFAAVCEGRRITKNMAIREKTAS
jgi:hypothetical protein